MHFHRSTFLFFTAVFLISCTGRQHPVKVANDPDSLKPVFRMPYDTLKDNSASFVAGKAFDYKGCFSFLDTMPSWKKYTFTMDSGFAFLDTSRFSKMTKWADSQIPDRFDTTLLFYPFGGPDFLNADIFYPAASEYILIGLEPVGELPDLCRMAPVAAEEYMHDVWLSLKDLFLRSYFITGNMIDALKRNEVNGALPVISMFIKRRGYNIVSVSNVAIDSTGKWQYAGDQETGRYSTRGVKIDFASDTGRTLQSVFYFRADISDEGLKKNKPFAAFLHSLPACHTYLKAASYLMHGKDFSVIRNLILDKSISVLQDDSGIAYRFFDKNIWDIKLFGKYSRPGKEFSWINETDLAEAYRDTSIKPVPFTLGYNWRTRAINLLYATKKKQQIPQ